MQDGRTLNSGVTTPKHSHASETDVFKCENSIRPTPTLGATLKLKMEERENVAQ